MTAFKRAFPRKRWRTMTSAHRTPKTVFNGTAMSAIRIVSQRAWRNSGSVTAFQKGEKPCSNVLKKTSPTGSTSRSDRYASAANRRPYLAFMLRSPAAEQVDRQQGQERKAEQHDGDCRGGCRPVTLDVGEDLHRGDLCVERDVPRDEDDGAEFPHGPGE